MGTTDVINSNCQFRYQLLNCARKESVIYPPVLKNDALLAILEKHLGLT